VQREHKTAQAVIVGGDEVSYGRKPQDAAHWREKMLREVKLDPTRTHFVGKLPYEQYKRVLQVSAAHVYLTYPFVLSWSVLEAMGCGALVVGSDTAPVREVIRDGVNGRLTGFFDVDGIAESVLGAVAGGRADGSLRHGAASVIRQRFSRAAGVEQYERIAGVDWTTRSLDAKGRIS
jgi:glycosyltransferase involved in cell wall biosynthesis